MNLGPCSFDVGLDITMQPLHKTTPHDLHMFKFSPRLQTNTALVSLVRENRPEHWLRLGRHRPFLRGGEEVLSLWIYVRTDSNVGNGASFSAIPLRTWYPTYLDPEHEKEANIEKRTVHTPWSLLGEPDEVSLEGLHEWWLVGGLYRGKARVPPIVVSKRTFLVAEERQCTSAMFDNGLAS